MALEEDRPFDLGGSESPFPARAKEGVDLPFGLAKSRDRQVGLEAPLFGREPKGASDRFGSRLKLEKRRGRLRDSHTENARVTSIREDPASTEVEGECREPRERFRKSRAKGLDAFGGNLPEKAKRKMKSLRTNPSRAPGERAKLAAELHKPPPNLGVEVKGEKSAHQSSRRNAKTQRVQEGG